MHPLNIPIVAATALIPLVVGFIWYHPKVFGNAWMQASGMTEEKAKTSNMPLVFGLTVLFSFFLAFGLVGLVIHQLHIYSSLMNDMAKPEVKELIDTFMASYGRNFRSFGHGALHGTLAGLTLALPIITVNGLFERKGFKYIAINTGYWTLCFLLMGGVICGFA